MPRFVEYCCTNFQQKLYYFCKIENFNISKLMYPKLLFFILFFTFKLFAQNDFTAKKLEAKRTTKIVKIDGKLDDDAWKDAALADDFAEFRPTIGKKDSLDDRTESYLMYDNNGIYFGGTCYESDVSQISKELVGRDGFGANDYIGIIFDTYKDKLNGFEYFVTPLGEQWDAKITANQNHDNGGEDFSWNAVWESAVIVHEKGWSYEVFIPFSAIRFSKDNLQDWGLNITRRRRKTERQNCWSPINPTVNGFLTQEGTWTGLTDIKPPLRLQFFPYFSTYANHFPANSADTKNWNGQVSGGLDLKLGLSQAFTLDATLIPDFGQVQSDNQILNLTPFEVKFNEYRTFFTEGTELFNKGNLFYSRRIGGTPIHLYEAYDAVSDKEKVSNNPSVSKLINATKISGRTSKGLGIGILNAVTKAQFATIDNIESGETRKFETDPATNYNIFVLDQTFKQNSSISFVNTSVIRGGDDRNANVSAGLFSLNDKKNTYQISGSAFFSKLNFKEKEEDSKGYSHNWAFNKTSGRFNFELSQSLTDTKFNSNDLGYFTNNNFLDHTIYTGYRIIKPKGWYNRVNFNLLGRMSNLFSPIADIDTKFQTGRVNLNINAQTKKIVFVGLFANYVTVSNDFYEPRQVGYYFKRGASVGYGSYVETNSAKKYSFGLEVFRRNFIDFYKLVGTDIYFRNNFRFSSKLSINHNLSLEPRSRAMGYSGTLGDNSIIFALRKIKTVNNVLVIKYNFTNKMGLSFRTRHYSSVVKNKEYFLLGKNSSFTAKNDPILNFDRNANYFNIDMVYTWQFAPGSFINVVWKDAGATETKLSAKKYLDNLGDITRSDQNNNLSFKIIYFIDYLNLKRK
jgi:Domain of unknown function (DUF5916)